MRDAGRDWGRHLTALVVGTARSWWSLLPALLSVYAVGWTGAQLLRYAAAVVAQWSPWTTLVLTAASFVIQLSAIIICLRLVGRFHDQRFGDVVPTESTGIGSTLGITLLPFLGIYSVFGAISDAAWTVSIQGFVLRRSIIEDVLTPLVPRTLHASLVAVAVIVGLYVLRRVLDGVQERTGRIEFGLLTAFVEAFFLLVFLVAGGRILANIVDWLQGRQLMQWVDTAVGGLSRVGRLIHIDLPAIVWAAWTWIVQVGWPEVISVVTEPILWLALVALVLGSEIVSFAELIRRTDATGRRARTITRQAMRHQKATTATLAVQDAFFGDLDEKYLPTWQAVKIVLRGGLAFLGAFVVLYSGLDTVSAWLDHLISLAWGPREAYTQATFGPFIDLAETTIVETLRLCLLVTAYTLLREPQAVAQLMVARDEGAAQVVEGAASGAVAGVAAGSEAETPGAERHPVPASGSHDGLTAPTTAPGAS